MSNLQRGATPVVDTAAGIGRVTAKGAAGNRQCPDVDDGAAEVVAVVRVAAMVRPEMVMFPGK